MRTGPAHDSANTSQEFLAMEWLCQILVGARLQRQSFHFGVRIAGKDQYRRVYVFAAKRAQNIDSGHVGQLQIKHYDVVFVLPAQIQAHFAEIGRCHLAALVKEHLLYACGDCVVVFDQENSHIGLSSEFEIDRSANAFVKLWLAHPRKKRELWHREGVSPSTK